MLPQSEAASNLLGSNVALLQRTTAELLLAPLYDQFLIHGYQTGGQLCRKLFGSVRIYILHVCIPQCAICSCLSQPACAHLVFLVWSWLLLALLRNRLVLLQDFILYFRWAPVQSQCLTFSTCCRPVFE